ncbi:MAG TPA: hypothetical protein DCR59_02770, partial [Dehalococcoidia bacterium]|nr:hypothetical protein [Dehalococcoidia bacterium]
MKQIYVESYYHSGYNHWMEKLNDILDHPKQKVIEERIKIIEFFDEYSEQATGKAFGKGRSTVYLWKQRLKKGGYRLSALAPGDKTLKRKKRRPGDPFIEGFIISYRTLHPGVYKATITPVLEEACKKKSIKPPSESTIGRVIHDLKEKGRLPKQTRISINGKTGKLHARSPVPRMKKTGRKGFYPKMPGELVEIDTVDIFVDGIKRYLITAIDLPPGFAFAYTCKSGSSSCTRDFLRKLKGVAPFKISRIQTDNGHEFPKHFSKECRQQGPVHYFNYPRHPQSNGHPERFNRT